MGTLYIIGNGFDLHFKLKHHFTSFFTKKYRTGLSDV